MFMSLIPHFFISKESIPYIFRIVYSLFCTFFYISLLSCSFEADRFYTAAQAVSRISSSAFLLLVWQRMISALQRPASSTAHRTILCETVFVNKTTRSGVPIFLDRFPDICVNTFALH